MLKLVKIQKLLDSPKMKMIWVEKEHRISSKEHLENVQDNSNPETIKDPIFYREMETASSPVLLGIKKR